MLEKWEETLACCQRAIEVSSLALGPLKWSFNVYSRMGSVEQRRAATVAAIGWNKWRW